MISHESTWSRICELYGLPGVMPHCLALQDMANVSVTTLLTLTVVAANGEGALAASHALRIAEVSEAFQASVLRHLRLVRTNLTEWADGPWMTAAHELRNRLLERELEAEKLEQTLILSVLNEPGANDRPGDPLFDCVRTVVRYLKAQGAQLTDELYQSLVLILTVALEQYDGIHVERALNAAFEEIR